MICLPQPINQRSFPMTSIKQVGQSMQRILSEQADQAARSTGFVQRNSKMGGAEFVQTLVFGWMSNPQATLEELTQTAASVGVTITPQGLDQRFTKAGADCLKNVLDQAVHELVQGTAPTNNFLKRFSGVYIQDSTIVDLPDELSEEWRGCGNQAGAGQPAAVKIEVRLNILEGEMIGPLLENGRIHDAVSQIQSVDLPKGALSIADLGYWSLPEMSRQAANGGFWLSRILTRAKVVTLDEKVWDLLAFLQAQSSGPIDCPILLTAQHRIPARLLAVRVAQEVADRRRHKLREEAQRRGKPISQKRLALAAWTILVTNLPAEMLTLRQAMILIRVRWQIELLFKLWKSHAHIDEWRSSKPWRILIEVYAKLLAMLVQHWLFLISFWRSANRSLFKAANTIQRHALLLAGSCASLDALVAAITVIQRCLTAGCRINKRKTDLRSFQLLLSLNQETLA
jgi:hypothetical protein